MGNPSQTDKAIYSMFNPQSLSRDSLLEGLEFWEGRQPNLWPLLDEAISQGYIEAGLEDAKVPVYHNITDMLSDKYSKSLLSEI